ncbi:MAG TPA: MFS transporter, partial [Chloroflexota bacterium]|nr:MFS transporter [Chloroflexota bacterium]
RVFSLDAALTLGATAVGSAAAGQLATALLAAGALELAAYRATLFGAAAIGATSFLFLVLTRTDTTWRRTRGSAAALGATRADAAADRGAARWVAVLREPAALKLAACAALVSLGAGLFAPYQNLFFVEELGAAPAVYGWLSAAATLTRLVATLAAPGMARRLGTGRAIGWTQLTSVPLLLLVGFGPGLGVVAPAFLVRGALMNMAAPLHVSLRMGVLPAAIHGAGNALITLSDQVVRTGSTWLGGQAIQHAGYRPGYAASAASYIASAVLFLLWFGREKDATRR